MAIPLASLVAQPVPQGAAIASMMPATQSVNPIEQEFFHRLKHNYADLVREYNEHPDTDKGKTLNTDVARELSHHYRKDRTKAADVHEPASSFIKQRYAEMLASPTPQGLSPVVLFTAGGTGAGKSSGMAKIKAINKDAQNAEITYDTNMNTYDSAKKKLDQALNSGRKVHVIYTYRDPVEAFENGTLTRAMGQEAKYGSGRVVPISEQIKTHLGARETIKRLMDEYKHNDKITFDVIDNSRGRNNAARSTMDKLPKMDPEKIEKGVYEVLERARATGKISESVYQGTRAHAR